MPAWNGFVGPKADPIIAAPALIAITVVPSTPIAPPSTINAGTKGMISSCMFSSAPIIAKKMETIGIVQSPPAPSAPTRSAMTACSAPSRSTTIQAPPTNRTTVITSAAAMKPRATPTALPNSPTGARGTGRYVPATTTRRPVFGSSRRSN
jgi:hypothetical protein